MKTLSRLLACAALSATASTAFAADIVDTAASAGQFTTLIAALERAGLVDTLRESGPFTVFAPTDEAFAKLPQGALEELLRDKEELTAVLTYHVVPGRVMAAEVKSGPVQTVQGEPLSIERKIDGVTVNEARIVKTDIAASNGVIHVIDSVVMPK